MGKGDKKSRRGKIYGGTFGVRRPRKKSLTGAVMAAPPKETVEEVEMAKPKAAAKARKKTTKK